VTHPQESGAGTRAPALALAALAALAPTVPAQEAGSGRAAPDVYVLVLDDLADTDLDLIPTPHIDRLAARGTRFRRAYAMPMCGPSRHALMFAEYRTEQHTFGCEREQTAVPLDQLSLPGALAAAGYETMLFGKWNVGGNAKGPKEMTPLYFGFEHWRAGIYSNVAAPKCEGTGYYDWRRIDDGVVTHSEEYVLAAIDRAVAGWQAQESARPRFAYVGFQSPHGPWAVPPPEVLSDDIEIPTPAVKPGTDEPPPIRDRQLYELALRAADEVIGRILERAGPEALIVLVGDNGTPSKGRRPRQARSQLKGTVYEDGIRVPLIVAGPGVGAGVETGALVHLVDVLPTLLELLGPGVPADARIDGVSFHEVLSDPSARPRDHVYSGIARNPNSGKGEEAVVTARWKLRVVAGKRETFHSLSADPREERPLVAREVPPDVVARLRRALAGARGE
jgi:arylsulfatase A-like enzyme